MTIFFCDENNNKSSGHRVQWHPIRYGKQIHILAVDRLSGGLLVSLVADDIRRTEVSEHLLKHHQSTTVPIKGAITISYQSMSTIQSFF